MAAGLYEEGSDKNQLAEIHRAVIGEPQRYAEDEITHPDAVPAPIRPEMLSSKEGLTPEFDNKRLQHLRRRIGEKWKDGELPLSSVLRTEEAVGLIGLYAFLEVKQNRANNGMRFAKRLTLLLEGEDYGTIADTESKDIDKLVRPSVIQVFSSVTAPTFLARQLRGLEVPDSPLRSNKVSFVTEEPTPDEQKTSVVTPDVMTELKPTPDTQTEVILVSEQVAESNLGQMEPGRPDLQLKAVVQSNGEEAQSALDLELIDIKLEDLQNDGQKRHVGGCLDALDIAELFGFEKDRPVTVLFRTLVRKGAINVKNPTFSRSRTGGRVTAHYRPEVIKILVRELKQSHEAKS